MLKILHATANKTTAAVICPPGSERKKSIKASMRIALTEHFKNVLTFTVWG
jgi:hypothetical protein